MKVVADENIPYVEEVFSHVGEVSTCPGRDIDAHVLSDTDILLVRSITQVGEPLLKRTKVKFVGTATIGVDHIDQKYLKKKKIGFTSAPGSNATSVAEYVISALLNLAKKNSFKLRDKSIGIIGVGNVGSRVEHRCRKLGMEVKLNDPPLFEKSGNPKYRKRGELFDCDIITVHTPLNREGKYKTLHMVDKAFLEKTKKGVIFINTSRGPVVDQRALKAFLDKGHFLGTILDVWENEPGIDVELLDKVDVGTPHIAGYSFDGKVRGVEMVYRAAVEYFDIESKWRLELPEPLVPEIKFKKKHKNEDDYLRNAVFPVYNVSEDDTRFRMIKMVEQKKKRGYFDKLRKEYPLRREFANTKVIMEKGSAGIKERLRALEFIV
jgi:erythronate-4-phosphate dehydrogenase